MPKSAWTVQDLKKLAIDPATLPNHKLCGVYLLVAAGIEKGKEAVVLYLGSSKHMDQRFNSHVTKITGDYTTIQYFHERCRELQVSTPLFIPVWHGTGIADIEFAESAGIAVVGKLSYTMSAFHFE